MARANLAFAAIGRACPPYEATGGARCPSRRYGFPRALRFAFTRRRKPREQGIPVLAGMP